MSTTVVLVVLASALIHASWNALLKLGDDPLLNTVLVASCCGLIGVVSLPFLDQPAPESWPYLAASAVAQVIYFLLLAAAYQTGDVSQTYPLMRGTAPLLVALASGPVIGEALPAGRWIAIVLISGGVLGLAFERAGLLMRQRAAIGFALANALVICAYTLIDGVGARRSGAPAAYTLWIFVLSSVPLLLWALARRRADFVRLVRRRLPVYLVGGAGTVGSYGLALWAMTVAPVASVAALRETSILFALMISAVILRETLSAARIVSAVAIAAGAIAIRLT